MRMMYGFMYKIKNLIMGLLGKKVKKQQEINKKEIERQHLEQREIQRQKEIEILKTKLTPDELQYLIGLIARSDFKGVDLQIIFSITAKLQNQLNS